MLDQVFQRTRRNEEKLDRIMSILMESQKRHVLVREKSELTEEAGTE